MDLKDKVALITGAGSGIGKACALKIASEGSRVIVHAHQEEETTATVEAIQHAGGAAFGITADLRDDEGLKAAIERGIGAFGALDIVVASIILISSINGTRVFSHGGASAYSTTKGGLLALGQMVALELAKHKIRVNVVCPGKVESKIDENTQSRSGEEASEPAEYPEGKIPLTNGQAGTGDDIAEMVAFLASDRARFITGTPVWIDGGQSLLVG